MSIAMGEAHMYEGRFARDSPNVSLGASTR
jgi:hypothetical protein